MKICKLLLFLLITINSFSQKNELRKEIDSLTSLISESSDLEKIQIYGQLFYSYRGYNLDSAEYFSKKSLDLALKSGNNTKIGYAFLHQGIMQFDRTKHEQSLESLKKSLAIGLDIKDSILISKSYRAIASTYSNLGNFNLSIQYIFKALPIFEKLKVDFEVGNTYTELASNLHRSKKYDEAKKYNLKALQIFIEQNNKIRQAVSYNNISNNLNGLKQFKESIINSKKADSLFAALGYKRFTAYSTGNMAIANDSLKNYKLANQLYLKSIQIHKKNNEYYELAFLQNALANLYLKNKQFSKALETAKEALSNANKSKALEFETYSNKTLGELYKRNKDFSKSTFHFEKYAILKDSLFKVEERKTQLELKEQYEVSKKEKEILKQREELLAQKLKLQNRNLYATIITGALLILAIIFFSIFKRNQFKRKQLQKEIDLKDALSKIKTQNRLQEQRLRISRDLHDNIGSQLTFIISSIDNLKYVSKDINQKLKEKLTNISAFTGDTIHQLRDTIWAMNKSEISVEDLHARILSFLEKAKVAVPNIQFDVSYEIDKNESFTSLAGMNLFRVIQEALNNAIKYAEADKIDILLNKVDNVFTATVTDNGKGFDLNEVQLGNGLSNMEKRMSEIGGKVKIISTPKKGTTIELKSEFKNTANDI